MDIAKLPQTPREMATLRRKIHALAKSNEEPVSSLAKTLLVLNDDVMQHAERLKQLEASMKKVLTSLRIPY